MVSTDDPYSRSYDIAVYVWGYVPVEYTSERIIACQSRHGLYHKF